MDMTNENKLVCTIKHECPNCGGIRDFNVITSTKCQPYRGKEIEYLGIDAVCKNCGNYVMFPELTELNFKNFREKVLYPNGVPTIELQSVPQEVVEEPESLFNKVKDKFHSIIDKKIKKEE